MFLLSASAWIALIETTVVTFNGVLTGPCTVCDISRPARGLQEQIIVTALVGGRYWIYAHLFLRINASLLDRSLFVDARWMDGVLEAGIIKIYISQFFFEVS